MNDTELRLSFWRDGSTKSERLAAAALKLSGYEEIDPQNPLGGPDGKKDIVCIKGGVRWVAAVFFPGGPKSFSAVKKKYLSDLAGATNEYGGFVFVTNQTLTAKQRVTLTKYATDLRKEADLIHLQQLQNLLDSPHGYGVRIQYLSIPMTLEEQLSWAVQSDSQTAQALTAHTRELLLLRASIERMSAGQEDIVRTFKLSAPMAPPTADLISVSSFVKSDSWSSISVQLTPAHILLFHRLLCFDLPKRSVGQLRTEDAWLGTSKGRSTELAQPMRPQDIKGGLEELCKAWVDEYPGLRNPDDKLRAISKFHARLLLIHPFLDGNGRVARAVLMQQCLDLFQRAE
ncbi:MAG TPA: hypothetical protein DDZ20_07580, partial [Hyphomonas sp.]|nr:hypothetical protein [Hyphomonas sp.]